MYLKIELLSLSSDNLKSYIWFLIDFNGFSPLTVFTVMFQLRVMGLNR